MSNLFAHALNYHAGANPQEVRDAHFAFGAIVAAGADTCVAGSAVFGAPDADGLYRGVIESLRRAAQGA